MKEHSEVGQQGIDALAVRGDKGQAVKGISHKAHHGDKKSLNHHQGGGGIGQGVPGGRRSPAQGNRRHGRQDQGNVEQRSLVAGVKGHPGVDVRHRPVAVGGHISHLKVPVDERPNQAEGSHQHGQGQHIDRPPGAFHQSRRAAQLPQNRSQGGIDGQGQANP